MLHFGNATTSRAEGIHATIKKEIPHRFLHLRDIINFMKLYLLQHNAGLKHKIAQDRDRIRNLHRQDLFAELHHTISSFAVEKVREHMKLYNLTMNTALPPCTKVFTATMGLPCSHYIQTLLRRPNPRLKVSNFHPQWRLDRLALLQPIPPLLLLRDPDRIPSRKRKGQRNEPRQRTHNENVQAEGSYRRQRAQNPSVPGVSHAQLQASLRAAVQAELRSQQQPVILPTRRQIERSESPDPLAHTPPPATQQLAPRPSKRRFSQIIQGEEEAIDIDSIDLTEEIDLTGS